jgi:nucleoside phosphorylase
MPPSKEPALANSEYRVGWICALPLEMTAARAMLDVLHEQPQEQHPSDHNSYCLGRIQKHNIVIGCLADYGTTSAAAVALNMLSTFTEIRFGLMVGIGGASPVQNMISGLETLWSAGPKAPQVVWCSTIRVKR